MACTKMTFASITYLTPLKALYESKEEPTDTKEEVEEIEEVDNKNIIPKVISFINSPLVPPLRVDLIADKK